MLFTHVITTKVVQNKQRRTVVLRAFECAHRSVNIGGGKVSTNRRQEGAVLTRGGSWRAVVAVVVMLAAEV